MWCFASWLNQMLTLKFENFEDKDDQNVFIIMQTIK